MTRAGLLRALVVLACAVGLRASAADPVFSDCDDCPLMQVVPAGAFTMGYEPDEDNPETDARPLHRVVIEYPFAVGVHEVTRGQFAAFVRDSGYDAGNQCNVYDTDWWYVKEGINWQTPGFDQGDDEPVVCVSWLDAKQFVAWLSDRTGRNYRLLSEAEWEYIARNRGTEGQLENIGHDTANLGAPECCGPRKEGKDRWERTAPVGSFAADELGLHDVRGNVWEWLEDCYHQDYEGAPVDGTARTANCSNPGDRVVRGGSYGDAVFYLRAGYRLRAPAENGYFTLGFRVARTLD